MFAAAREFANFVYLKNMWVWIRSDHQNRDSKTMLYKAPYKILKPQIRFYQSFLPGGHFTIDLVGNTVESDHICKPSSWIAHMLLLLLSNWMQPENRLSILEPISETHFLYEICPPREADSVNLGRLAQQFAGALD